VRLFVTMARNKLVSAARQHHAHKRDARRVSPADEAELDSLEDPGPSPSRLVRNKDLLDRIRRDLTKEERELADLRAQGLTWPEIAERVGGSAQTRRVQFSRAIERVRRTHGLQDDA
jgi:RNA polymerase sigma factor (sigma-70 family)